jgi:hypothetical protein
MTILPETWYCEGCDEPHATETAAADCCGLPPAFGYLCPICGLGSESEAEALECCGWERTREGYQTIRRTLEANGQLAMPF